MTHEVKIEADEVAETQADAEAEVTPDSEKTVARKKRRNAWSHKEKLKLITAVKLTRTLWDRADAKHFDNAALCVAWLKVAAEMEKPVEECKSAWASLRDSRRYHQSCKSLANWEFSKALSFLPNMVKRRRKDFNEAYDAMSEAESESSNSYCNLSQTSTPLLQSNIEVCTSTERHRHISVTDLAEAVPKEESNTNRTAASLTYLQNLLSQLPDSVAQELTFGFISTTQNEISNRRK